MDSIQIRIEKIIPGGQSLARLEDGRVCFVWGALPGELIKIRVTKRKSKYIEAVTEDVLEASEYRVSPKDEAFLSTSPWQIFDFEYENSQKEALIREVFLQQKIELPEFKIFADDREYFYRNKMEYSFWWVPETDRVELAFHKRGSHSRVPVESSSLEMPAITVAAQELIEQINQYKFEARKLKSVVFRADQSGQVAMSLFVKEDFPAIQNLHINSVSGFEIWLSDPRSPASIKTKRLVKKGSTVLADKILGNEFAYDVHSFFQVNLPVYEQAVSDICEHVKDKKTVVDMYSGVGSIGLSAATNPLLIEIDQPTYKYLEKNAAQKNAQTILSSAEASTAYIEPGITLIVDPPRAGLHKDILNKLSEVQVDKIVYLSCDAATHARDCALLIAAGYSMIDFKAYNFFPKTPHTESLAIFENS